MRHLHDEVRTRQSFSATLKKITISGCAIVPDEDRHPLCADRFERTRARSTTFDSTGDHDGNIGHAVDEAIATHRIACMEPRPRVLRADEYERAGREGLA